MKFLPTKKIAEEAKKGLNWRAMYERGGTSVGIARATQLSSRQELFLQDLKSMYAYFSRHKVDKKASSWDAPSNGHIAWLLWGGDSAYKWVGELRQKLIKQKKWFNNK